MFSWFKSIRKGFLGAFPAVPAFLLVRLLRSAGVEVSEAEALELYTFAFAVLGFLIAGGRNVRKNRRKTPAAVEDPAS